MTNHPITPPPELVEQWRTQPEFAEPGLTSVVSMTQSRLRDIATQAAQWGADMELEACCEWLDRNSPVIGGFHLRIDRRPKPPSLRKQGYEALDTYIYGEPDTKDKERTYNTIRRALEQLDD